MRNLKKVLSLVLCVAMMLSVMVVGAGAAFSDQSKIKNTEAVDMCVALNIIGGYPDGSYKPEGNITRAEFCKMVCIALNGGKEPATATKSTPTYSDIQGNWAEGYIEYCSAKGIVSGVGGGKFNPTGNVTATQAAKMLLVALGYNADVEKYNGSNWSLYVNVQANQDGLYKDIEDIDTGAALTRDNAAQMVWNTIQAYVINKSTSIDRTDGSITDVYEKSETVDLLEKMYKGDIKEGTLTDFTYNSNDNDWTYTVDSVTVKSATDYTALLGQKVKAVYDTSTKGATKDAYGIFATDSEVVLSGNIGDLPTIAADSTATSFKLSGTTYKTDKAINETPVYQYSPDMDTLLATNSNLDDVASVGTYASLKFDAVDYDGNGKIDFFMVYPVSVAKVMSVSSSTVKLQAVATLGKAVNTSVDVDDATIYSGIAKGDYVAYTAAGNTSNDTEVLVKADKISGKISKKSGDDVTIGDNVYTVDASYTGSSTVGTTLTDAVVVNGYIFYADGNASADATDYVVVTAKDKDGYGSTAKLLFSDNTKKVVDLDSDMDYNKVVVGSIYTYEKNSDDEYMLTPVAALSDATAGTFASTSKTGTKVAYIDGNTVLDDSVIFVAYNNNSSFKAISGAKMKTMAKADFTNVVYLSNNSNSTTGVGDLNFAYVTSSETDIASGDKYYGYVTDISSVKNSDNKTVYEYTLWTENGETTVKTEAGLSGAGSITKNSVLAYKLNSDGEISNVAAATVNEGAVTKISSAFMTVGTSGTTYYFDDDVIIVTIETDETEGVANGCTYKDIGTADGSTNNVYYVLNSENEVVFVAYDVDNAITH